MKDVLDFKKFNSLDALQAVGSPYGSRRQALSLEVRGFRMQPGEANSPVQLERQGYTFFTRPHLNLHTHNCLRTRHMIQLLNKDASSIQAWIRNTLCPSIALTQEEGLQSPLVQHDLGFIPLLTNALKTLSGWPDYALETYTSTEGQAKEVHSMVDSKLDYLREFDLDATFHNMGEEPIARLFYTWLRYEAMVYEGRLNPLPRFIANNELDYNTRIYRIITDRNDLYVSKIAACGASFPISLPTGEFANYDSTQVLAPKKDITIRFKCNGAMYYDDILKQEFNEVVMIFNPNIRTAYRQGNLGKKGSAFRDVARSGMKDKFRGYVYPFIDLATDRFMWLVDTTHPRVSYILTLLEHLGEDVFNKD